MVPRTRVMAKSLCLAIAVRHRGDVIVTSQRGQSALMPPIACAAATRSAEIRRVPRVGQPLRRGRFAWPPENGRGEGHTGALLRGPLRA